MWDVPVSELRQVCPSGWKQQKSTLLRPQTGLLCGFQVGPAHSSGGAHLLKSQSCFFAAGTHPALGSGDGTAGKDDLESQAPLFRPTQTYTTGQSPSPALGLMVPVRWAFLAGSETHAHFLLLSIKHI